MTQIIDIKDKFSATATSWESIDWKKMTETVNKIRSLIFVAQKKGKVKQVRRLQDIMLRSKANIVISIRRITNINQGKDTPGLDKMLVKTNKTRWNLYLEVSNLKLKDWTKIAKPVKRTYIPKPNGKFRSLGIPTIKDRVIQNMTKNALEPEWEALFESSSYGFRPCRSCHDALSRIFLSTARHKKKMWALDADIKGCFDNLNHEFLLQQIGNFPAKEAIRAWLQAGYCEFPNSEIFNTSSGTPQGGVISPLLANIALHGIEKVLDIKTVSTTGHNYSTNSYSYVRYADDFIVLAESKELCENAKKKIEIWLKKRGLEFAPEKIKIAHLTEGIAFLGCQVRLYGNQRPKLLIKPHSDKVKALKDKCREIWLKYKGQAPLGLIKELNPIIRGWANYYSPFVSSEIFSDLDNFMWYRAWRYVKRRHPHKNSSWRTERYFGTQQGSKNKWRFYCTMGDKIKIFLLLFSDVKIKRHIIVKNNMCPDDSSTEARKYWEKRIANRQHLRWRNYESRLKLAKKQYHICPICYNTIYNDEDLHVHHIVPKKHGGKDTYGNLVILHYMCHKQVHSLKLEEKEMRKRLFDLRKMMKSKLAVDYGAIKL